MSRIKGKDFFRKPREASAPPPPPQVKRCEHPGCDRPAHFGLKAFRQPGNWYCRSHKDQHDDPRTP